MMRLGQSFLKHEGQETVLYYYWEKKLSDYQMEVEGFTGQIGKLLETSVSSKSFAISVLSHFNF